MNWIVAINWFACWICVAIGMGLGMIISAVFGGTR